MSGPQDNDVCGRCGVEWWEHDTEDSSTIARYQSLGKPEPRRCPPARFLTNTKIAKGGPSKEVWMTLSILQTAAIAFMVWVEFTT